MPIDSKLGALAQMDPRDSANKQTIEVEAWAEQVIQSLHPASSQPTPRSSRGKVAPLAISIDEQPRFKPADAVGTPLHANAAYTTAPRARREPLRRDSLNRREALVKGHEGSRRRQRWENGWYQTK